MGLASSLPRFARRARKLARAFGLALGLLDALAGPLELLFGDSQALLGDLGLQSCALERLRLTRRGRFGRGVRRYWIRPVPRARWRRAGGSFFAGSLPHSQRRVVGEGDQCHTIGGALASPIWRGPYGAVSVRGQAASWP